MSSHPDRARSFWLILAAAAFIGIVGMSGRAEAQQACELATAQELRAALGVDVPLTSSNPDLCMGKAANGRVLLRRAKREGDVAGAKETAGLEAVRKLGVKVDVLREGPLTCSRTIPPPNLAQYGFNTTCSIFKNGYVMAAEVTARREQDMATFEQVRALVEKMAARAK